jgi:hypothetical protein
MPGDITEENCFGAGSDTLPWFWHIADDQIIDEVNINP